MSGNFFTKDPNKIFLVGWGWGVAGAGVSGFLYCESKFKGSQKNHGGGGERDEERDEEAGLE